MPFIDDQLRVQFGEPPAITQLRRSIGEHHPAWSLVVALGSGGKDIPLDKALECVYGYAVALDMTRRDLQGECKKAGRPWEIGKAFEHSAPCSDIVPAASIGHPAEGEIWLKVNGETRQTGDLNHMIWKVPEMISYLSGLFTLAAGDLIYSGTPSGVGAVVRGDVMHGGVEGVGEIEISVA
jgi:fumarylpyruvate hydrolase